MRNVRRQLGYPVRIEYDTRPGIRNGAHGDVVVPVLVIAGGVMQRRGVGHTARPAPLQAQIDVGLLEFRLHLRVHASGAFVCLMPEYHHFPQPSCGQNRLDLCESFLVYMRRHTRDTTQLASSFTMASPVQSNGTKRPYPLFFTARELREKKARLAALPPREQVLENPLLLSGASDSLKNDEELVRACVKRIGWLLRYASTELRDKHPVVEAAVKQCGRALQYASEDLQDRKPLVLTAVLEDGEAVEYASTRLRGDKDVMRAAVEQKGTALMHGTGEIKSNRDIVLAAVTQDGKAIEYASEELQTQRELVLAAARTYGSALQYADEKLLGDKSFVLACVRQHAYALEFAGEFRKDTDVVWAAFWQNPLLLEYADDAFKNNEETVETLVKLDACALMCASDECKQNLRVVLAAVEKHGFAAKFMHPTLSDNRKVFEIAVRTYPEAVQFASKKTAR